MTEPPPLPPPLIPAPAPSPATVPGAGKTLRKLFLTLFLRGRSARGMKKDATPKSVGSKLALALLVYALMGVFVVTLHDQPVFLISLYLHGMTMVFLGMFVAGSAGEVLFNKDEPDILLHRPVTARQLLWAKVTMMVQVALWLAGALNLAGFFVGIGASDGGWLYPVVHALSTTLEAMLCTGGVVVLYQLCLRWFGRERLDGVMTTVQVLASIVVVAGGQIIPRMMAQFRVGQSSWLHSWWMDLLPPVWFAGMDDALAGSGARNSWGVAVVGMVATLIVVGLAFGKLAQDYTKGLQVLSETSSKPPRRAGRRWVDAMVGVPPLSWWLRDSVSRASFLLTAAYLTRDRDVKLRIYPGLAPMLVIPFIFLLQGGKAGFGANFGAAFTGAYLGLIPLISLDMLRYSQQWQASDLFRVAPMRGPGPLCHGARRAVLCFLTLPLLVLFAIVGWLVVPNRSSLLLLVPGVLALPVYSLVPCLGGKAVPFSEPNEEAQPAKRSIKMIVVMMISFALSGIAIWAWMTGWFIWFLMGEAVTVIVIYLGLRSRIDAARWPSME
jgi:ABC-2 type transport system permease protein